MSIDAKNLRMSPVATYNQIFTKIMELRKCNLRQNLPGLRGRCNEFSLHTLQQMNRKDLINVFRILIEDFNMISWNTLIKKYFTKNIHCQFFSLIMLILIIMAGGGGNRTGKNQRNQCSYLKIKFTLNLYNLFHQKFLKSLTLIEQFLTLTINVNYLVREADSVRWKSC